jgi:Uma2 family endonuclease
MTAQDVSPPPGKYRLKVDDYLTLFDAGAFEGLRTELIEGDVIVMSPQYRPHGVIKMALYDALRDRLKDLDSPLTPLVEVSLALDAHSLPDPDLLLTSEPRGAGPVPLSSVGLIIEVADTSLAKDMGGKAALYARHRVPEYWVVDVNERTIHQLWSPIDDAYTERREIEFGAPVTAATIADLTVETATL